jgi:hypothetical protein
MMRINTPLHTDHQLDQLAGQFERWRQNRSHPSERIPQTLWKQAADLAKALPYSRVAQHLRLSPSDLKKQIGTQPQPASQVPAPALRFVEVPPSPEQPQVRPDTEIELQRADGARLHLRCGDATLPLAALVRAFLEAH